jgi:hypothetical protein
MRARGRERAAVTGLSWASEAARCPEQTALALQHCWRRDNAHSTWKGAASTSLPPPMISQSMPDRSRGKRRKQGFAGKPFEAAWHLAQLGDPASPCRRGDRRHRHQVVRSGDALRVQTAAKFRVRAGHLDGQSQRWDVRVPKGRHRIAFYKAMFEAFFYFPMIPFLKYLIKTSPDKASPCPR